MRRLARPVRPNSNGKGTLQVGFDVFHNEPLKGDHQLTRLDNVTLSAHAAFRTLEASMTLLRRALDIVKRVQS